MGRYKLVIKLESDLCTSGGGIYNDAVDTEIIADKYGFPYIPGKRIKGCLRECAEELNDWGERIDEEKIFGMPGNDAGNLKIENAYPTNYDVYKEELRTCGSSVIVHPQNVMGVYTYLRSQTAIDYKSGIAKDESLRTMRVVNKDTVFESRVVVSEEYKESLEKCLKVFKHMGMARTRGFGEISAFLTKENESGETMTQNIENDDPICIREGYSALLYRFDLEEPVVCKSINGQEENSLDYIDGGKFLGCIAGEMGNKFLKMMSEGDLYVSNAYLCTKGRRLSEAPFSVYTIKNNKTDCRDNVYRNDENKTEDDRQCLQFQQIKHCYVDMSEDSIKVFSVRVEEKYHHTRPDDKSIGRALDDEYNVGEMYQFSAISSGQSFSGFIVGTKKQITEIHEIFSNVHYVNIGYANSAEYGKCHLSLRDYNTVACEKICGDFAVWLKSPAIIYNDKAACSTDAEDLAEDIKAELGINGKAQLEKTFVKVTEVGGYNVTWNARKPTLAAFDKGSVLVFKGSGINISAGTYFIGERRNEGYGEIAIAPIDDNGKYKRVYLKPDMDTVGVTPQCSVVNVAEKELIKDIADNLFKEYYKSKATEQAGKYPIGNQEVIKPTVANMLLMCNDAGSLDEMRDACKKRYAKKDEGKQKKQDKSSDLLSRAEESINSMVVQFEKEFNITGYTAETGWEIDYLYEYLANIKYVIRHLKKVNKPEGQEVLV